MLIKRGANVNARTLTEGLTPLHYTVNKPSSRIAKLLFLYNANPEMRNLEGNTPFEHALKLKSKMISKTIIYQMNLT